MFDRELPARPNLEQYKKQAKDLTRHCVLGNPDALARARNITLACTTWRKAIRPQGRSA